MSRRNIPDDPGLISTTRRSPLGPYVGASWRRPTRFARLAALDKLLQELSHAFGPQYWWPARTPFEVFVGAVLVQNTAWSNVVSALSNLEGRDCMSPAAILNLSLGELEQVLKPSGTFRAKAKKLRALSDWYLESGGLAAMKIRSFKSVRSELLAVHGIGPETADAILCYGAGWQTPVVDTYARRVLIRHNFISEPSSYEEVREWLRGTLTASLLVHQEFHALVVRAGVEACKPTPRCEACPAATPWGNQGHVQDA